MTLIKSISGIRGTLGGRAGDGLSPLDIVKYTSAYAAWLQREAGRQDLSVVVGRDARISGPMVSSLVTSTLMGMGCRVTDIGLASTPTVEVAVAGLKADGGIIVTASHNPGHWNALKLLDRRGEFLTAEAGEQVLSLAEAGEFVFAGAGQLGTLERRDYTREHVEHVKALSLVSADAIRAAGFTIAVDAVNSVGGIVLPLLLRELGVSRVVMINGEPTGRFAHDPEPLARNLEETCRLVRESGAHAGFVTDPDVDRLAIINEDGSLFNEEYTLVACADYVLRHTPGDTVSNLSSSRALHDVTAWYGFRHHASAVGEVNVVAAMKAAAAVIGGEGNGGIIYPPCHYGRDALVGIGLFLSHLALSGIPCSRLRKKYPDYYMAKNKIALTPDRDTGNLLEAVRQSFASHPVNVTDGLKIDFPDSWVHLRKSNTEPVIRIYAEARSQEEADSLAGRFAGLIAGLAG